MIVLHGGYLLSLSDAASSGFHLWAEGAFDATAPRPLHPRALPGPALDALLRSGAGSLFGASLLARSRVRRVALAVPAGRNRPVPSVAALRDGDDYATAGAISLRTFELDALFPPPSRVLDLLVHLPEALPAEPGGLSAGDDLEYWIEVARWAFDLLLRRRVLPTIDEGRGRWHPVLFDPSEKERLAAFASAMPPAGRTVALPGEAAPGEPLFPPAEAVLRAALDDLVDAAARELIRDVVPAERRRGGASPETQFLAALTLPRDSREGDAEPRWPAPLVERITSWSLTLLEPHPEGDLRLGLTLAPPAAEGAPWRLAFHLEDVEDPTLRLPAAEIWGSAEPALKRFGRRFQNPQEVLLARLGTAAALSPPVARSLDERHPDGADLSLPEAHRFLTAEAKSLADAGVKVLLPGQGRAVRPTVRLTVRESSWKAGSAVTRFGLSTLVDFDWRIAVGDVLLAPEEFEELAERKVPLVKVRGEWVVLDAESVQRTLQLLDRRPGGHTTLADLLRLSGGLDAPEEADLIESVEGEGWLADFLDPYAAREAVARFAPPASLAGTLRPYQVRGVAWLRFLSSRGLGSCLADDMGLGKTVQFLATLLSAREAGEPFRPSLLVCPTSVAENWRREAERFAPGLRVAVHHGPDRVSGEAFAELLSAVDLLVTTYPLAHRDRALLSRVTWEYLALDEAQNVKNPATAQSRAVRSFTARRRAALTGTPMENRLSELKAILDFLNPGLLGSEERFRKEFSVPIERHRDALAAERLRRVTAPFLLRRLKTDPSIEPDLPEKIETKEMVGLSREQASLYRATTRSLLEGIGRAKGPGRRAKVLVLLLRLKQICNHPTLFLADGSRLDGRSAKLTRLLEMLEETSAERRPSLLFTQFAEMGHLLVGAIRERFGSEVLFLHGGVPRKARDEMVRRFQEDDDPPLFFVLSLKAGGSGLNLTRASHVFHFDRWWNPAVEDQATDRVFRIGQTRHVQVHKFVCRGTLEERIDQMIDEKKDLARSIVGAGESWIAGLSDRELQDLVTLSRDAVDDPEGRR